MAYQKGESGNPSGRKKGSRNKRGLIIEALDTLSEEKGFNVTEAIIKRIAEDALSGDPQSARILLDRTVPAYKPVNKPIQLEAPLPENQHERATELFNLATNGTISLDEFTTLLSIVTEMKKIEGKDKTEKQFAYLDF